MPVNPQQLARILLSYLKDEPIDHQYWLGRAAYWHAFCEARNNCLLRAYRKGKHKGPCEEPITLRSESLMAHDMLNVFLDFSPIRDGGIYGLLLRTGLMEADWESVGKALVLEMLESLETIDVDGYIAEGIRDGHYDRLPGEIRDDE